MAILVRSLDGLFTPELAACASAELHHASALQEAAACVEEAAEGMARRRELREANLSPKRPGEGGSGPAARGWGCARALLKPPAPPRPAPRCPAGEAELKGLDSSMKRNTALLRKLRQLGEDTRASLLEEVAKVNQSKVGGRGRRQGAEAEGGAPLDCSPPLTLTRRS